MNRLRRAWAVLRFRLVNAAYVLITGESMREASLRASLDDATRTIARLSAEKAGLERVLRTILEAADTGLANPTENHR